MARHRSWVNAVVLMVLRSPAHWLLSGRLCEVAYRAPSDGRVIRLPAQYASRGYELVILVGAATAKRSWRAFLVPRPVTIRQAGRTWAGVARTIHPDHPTSQPVREAYERAWPVRISSADRIVLIDPMTEEKPCTSSPELRSTRTS
jgi:hypothetical protein